MTSPALFKDYTCFSFLFYNMASCCIELTLYVAYRKLPRGNMESHFYINALYFRVYADEEQLN